MNNLYKNYLKWKMWEENNFGKLTPQKKVYFDALFKHIRLDQFQFVCEIGFGNGELISYLQKKCTFVCGVEVQNLLIERLIEKNIPAKKSISEYENIEFDLIVLLDVLEHIEAGDLLGFIESIKNKLSDNGIIIARFPNGDSPFSLENQNGDLTHTTYIGTHKIKSIADSIGLKIIRIDGEPLPILQKDGLFKAINRAIARMLRLMIRKFLSKILMLPINKNYFSSNLIVTLKK